MAGTILSSKHHHLKVVNSRVRVRVFKMHLIIDVFQTRRNSEQKLIHKNRKVFKLQVVRGERSGVLSVYGCKVRVCLGFKVVEILVH